MLLLGEAGQVDLAGRGSRQRLAELDNVRHHVARPPLPPLLAVVQHVRVGKVARSVRGDDRPDACAFPPTMISSPGPGRALRPKERANKRSSTHGSLAFYAPLQGLSDDLCNKSGTTRAVRCPAGGAPDVSAGRAKDGGDRDEGDHDR